MAYMDSKFPEIYNVTSTLDALLWAKQDSLSKLPWRSEDFLVKSLKHYTL